MSRVTGNDPSDILGRLGVLGDANLFLINPNGISFGPSSTLDLNGSFVGSTASAVNLADGTQFSATAPQATPLLTISVPIGLQYGGTAGSILNQSRATNSSGQVVGLAVQPGKTITLLGGDVRLDGGNLLAPGGRVELGGVAGAGTVGLQVDGNNLSLIPPPQEVPRADVSLTNRAIVAVAAGGGGSIAVNARSLDVLGGSALFAGMLPGQGSITSQAGDITLNATGTITVAGSNIFNSPIPQAVGKGGNINIQAGSLSLTDKAILGTGTAGAGDAGSISVRVDDSVSLANNSYILTSVLGRAVGKGGNIDIQARSLSLRDNAQLNTGTFGQGDAGSISVQVDDSLSLANSLISSSVLPGAVGKGGNINIQARSLSLTDNLVQSITGLNTTTYGQGDAGSILIQASDFVSVVNAGILSNNAGDILAAGKVAVGKAGDINILTGSLSLTDRAQVVSNTFGQGDAGSVSVRASDSISLAANSLISSIVAPGAVGKGGNIDIQARSLFLTDGANLSTNTVGRGNAGSVVVQATDTVSLANSFILSNVGSRQRQPTVGNVGNIIIEAGNVSLTDGGQLQAGFYSGGQGNAGIVSVKARDSVSFAGTNSGILTNAESGAVGNGSDIQISAGSVSFTDGAGLKASNAGAGNAGNVSITARDAVTIAGMDSGKFTVVNTTVTKGAVGNGGNIDIQARSLFLTDGGELFASTYGQGNAGNIQVNASDNVTISGVDSLNGFSSGIFASTNGTSTGRGGDITVNTRAFRISDGAVVDATTTSGRDGGQIVINANTLEALGGGQLITTAKNSGRAGDITVNATDSITLSGSDPTLASRRAQFDPRDTRIVVTNASPESGLFANTASGEGGNITLQAQDFLLMRDRSEISATAGAEGGGGDGGNITINSPFLIALPGENSDITANAFSGRGGRVDITAQNFGFTPRSRQELQTLLTTNNPNQLDPSLLPSNDITAISQTNPQLSGFVTFNSPDVDPSRGLVELPAQLVDASNQIASGCAAGGENKFTISGRGGLPPNPREPLNDEAVLRNWATLEGAGSGEQGAGSRGTLERNSFFSPSPHHPITPSPHHPLSPSSTIVEATGWALNDKGEVVLTASAPTTTLNIPWLPSSNCHAPKTSSPSMMR